MSNDKFIILLMNSSVHRVGDLRYLWWRQKNAGYPRVPTELTKYKHIEWVRKLHIYCVEKPLKLRPIGNIISYKNLCRYDGEYDCSYEQLLFNRNNNFC